MLCGCPPADPLSVWEELSRKKSWPEAMPQASGCSLSPRPHPSWYQGPGLGPRLGQIRGPTRALHLEVTSVLQRRGTGQGGKKGMTLFIQEMLTGGLLYTEYPANE